MKLSNQTVIVTDSSSDLSKELFTTYGIYHLPLYVTLGEKTYRDGVDITPQELYDYVATYKQLPHTAAPSIYDFTCLFKELRSEGKEIVFIGLGNDFSSTFSNASIAAEEFDQIHLVDSQSLSTGVGLLVLYAASLAKEGLSGSEIASLVTLKTALVDASFIIEKLEFLHKGGRCSAVTAFGANALNIKPCILVSNGKMIVGEKYRGNLQKCISSYISHHLSNTENIDPTRCFITHTISDPNLIDYAYTAIQENFTFDEILETNAGCTIASHCGEGTLGILFFRNK